MEKWLWWGLGFLGQGMFFMRFFMQWLESEKKGESVIPLSFWFFSLAGSAILLVYAIHIEDPVIILGQTCGFFIYFRNLYLIARKEGRLASPGEIEIQVAEKERQLADLQAELEALRLRLPQVTG